MQTLIINIKELVQVRETSVEKVSGSEMAVLPSIKNAFLLIENETITDFGSMENCPKTTVDKTIDASGKLCFQLGVTAIPILFMLATENRNLSIE